MTTPRVPSAEELVDSVLIWIEDLPKQIEAVEDFRNAVLEAAAEVVEETEVMIPTGSMLATMSNLKKIAAEIRALKEDP